MNDFHPRSSRIDSSRLTYVGLDNDNGGILLNASEGGIAVRIVNGLPLRSKVQLQLRVPGKPPIEACGEVVWTDGSRRAGIRFIEIGEHSRQQLRDWVLAEGGPGPLNDEIENSTPVVPTLFPSTGSTPPQTPAETRSAGHELSTEIPSQIGADHSQQPTFDLERFRPGHRDAMSLASNPHGAMARLMSFCFGKGLSSRRLVPMLVGIAIVVVCGMVGWFYLRTIDAHAKTATTLVESPVQHGVTPATLQPSQAQTDGKFGQPSQSSLITGIQVRPEGRDSTTVEIALERGAKYTANRLSSPDRIFFDIEADLVPQLWGKASSLETGPVVKFRSAERGAGVTRVTLQTRDLCAYSVNMKADPHRLVIEVHAGHL
jgi:hypothetical protein